MSITPLIVGDQVTWSSQAGGNTKTKTGRVVALIPPGRESGKSARAFIDAKVSKRTHRSAFGGGWDRDHESYIVEVVVGGPRAKPVLYWPIVSKLAKA